MPAPANEAARSSSDAPKPPGESVHRATGSGSLPVVTAGLRTHLEDIKAMLESQTGLIQAQNEKIERLTAEVEDLKGRK